QALNIQEQLLVAEPGDVPALLINQGDTLLRLGEVAVARDSYHQALDMSRRLADAVPADFVAQVNLAASNARLGSPAHQNIDFPRGERFYLQGHNALWQLDNEGKLNGQLPYAAWMKELRDSLNFCRLVNRSVDSLDFALSQPPDLVPELLTGRAVVLARRGKH